MKANAAISTKERHTRKRSDSAPEPVSDSRPDPAQVHQDLVITQRTSQVLEKYTYDPAGELTEPPMNMQQLAWLVNHLSDFPHYYAFSQLDLDFGLPTSEVVQVINFFHYPPNIKGTL